MTDSRYQVLIIDDTPEDRYALRRYLAATTSSVFDVAEAASGKEGLAQCKRLSPDCILLDYSLPDLNGVEFLAQLQTQFGDNAPAVVMLIGPGNERLAVESMKCGAQDYLVKGNDNARICHAVPAAVESIRLRKRLALQALQVQQLLDEREKLVSELHLSAMELKDADRRKDEFLATLAHELRDPLAPIRTAMLVLKQSYPAAELVNTLYGVMERQMTHLTRLVGDLMDIARMTTGKVELKRESVSLATVMMQVTHECQAFVEASGHTLDTSYPQAEVAIDVDPVRLVQILANILCNACRNTPQPGAIRLSVGVEDKNLVCTITDSRTGIDEASPSSSVGKLEQVEPVYGNLPKGLGIGLSLARQFAELHGGNISYQSAGLGQGSQFVVTLPVVAVPVVARPVARERAKSAKIHPVKVNDSGAVLEPRNILVVDDNRDSADMLRLLLESNGFSVATAYSGGDAINRIKQHTPHIVLMDLGMPGMDGYEAVRRIREQSNGVGILIIALTGWNHVEARQRTQAAGFDHHMVKPVVYEKLKLLFN